MYDYCYKDNRFSEIAPNKRYNISFIGPNNRQEIHFFRPDGAMGRIRQLILIGTLYVKFRPSDCKIIFLFSFFCFILD